LNRKNPNTAIKKPVTIVIVIERENYDSKDVVFAATSKVRVSRKICGFVTVEFVDIIALF
jgi:hypothetical protein